jgi:tetratricopeptide (TPR) repeat protein
MQTPLYKEKRREKSNLLLKAQLAEAEGKEDEASQFFAEAAQLEEQLAAECEKEVNNEKAHAHCFSAASCWAQAGDFYRALRLCEQLLKETTVTPRLREQISSYAQSLRLRRSFLWQSLRQENNTFQTV